MTATAPTLDSKRAFTFRLGRVLTRALAGLALVGVLTFSSAAFAGEAGDLVKTRQTEVATLLHQKASAARDKQVAESLAQLFDFDVIATKSLEGVYDTLSDDEKAQFKTTLKKLVQKNIEKNIRATLDYDIAYLGEEAGDGGVTVVKTSATSKDKPGDDPVQINYIMQKTDSGWHAISTVTEGSDMVTNYKHQFVRIVKKDGFAALMKKMNAKLAAGGN